MSERMSYHDVLREYGVPLISLQVKATQEDCLQLREWLMDIH